MRTAIEALQTLKEGNHRFAADQVTFSTSGQDRRDELVEGQAPFAIILGCADSRAPAELIFDQGLGDLFVIRVAGNIVAPSLIGSVEFAAEQFGTRLVVVMGHTRCGAVQATIDQLQTSEKHRSPHLASIVDRIRPAVESLVDLSETLEPERLMREAVRANVRASANDLRHGSLVLEHLALHDGLLIVGAEYSLETGRVDFFDGVPGEL